MLNRLIIILAYILSLLILQAIQGEGVDCFNYVTGTIIGDII